MMAIRRVPRMLCGKWSFQGPSNRAARAALEFLDGREKSRPLFFGTAVPLAQPKLVALSILVRAGC